MSEPDSVSRQSRLQRFLRKPWRTKVNAVLYWWVRAIPRVPVPIRLPFGAWWLARNDFVGAALFHGGFEDAECSFMERFLQPGMTVLDVGAHHGFYTLLASRKVGSEGRVLAVEASPRERKKLERHLRINRCRNVQIEPSALGEKAEQAEFHLVLGGQTGCNSLRKPAVSDSTEVISVRVQRLDHLLLERRLEKVDLVKLDVEGGELSVLKGGRELLRRQPRPVFLVEVQDIRTRTWGYAAREVVDFLSCVNYRWFRPLADGRLQLLDVDEGGYDGNFVAIPTERIDCLQDIIHND